MSMFSITHAVLFSKQEVLTRGQQVVAQARLKVHEMIGRKNNCKLNFFSMYFVRNKEEIHFCFKNSEKQQTQALKNMESFTLQN